MIEDPAGVDTDKDPTLEISQMVKNEPEHIKNQSFLSRKLIHINYGSHKKIIFFSGQATKALPPSSLVATFFR